jgi:hypothetical protein
MPATKLYYIYENITFIEAAYFCKNLQREFNFISSRARHIYHLQWRIYAKQGVGVSSIQSSMKIK